MFGGKWCAIGIALSIFSVVSCTKNDQSPAQKVTEAATTTAPNIPGVVIPAAISIEIAGVWRGRYVYVTKMRHSVEFSATLTQTGNQFSGKVLEPNTFDMSPVKELHADIRGTIDNAGVVKFTKVYDGTGGATHSVDYEGQLSADGSNITGKWTVLQSTGTFTLDRAPAAAKKN